MRVRSMCDQEVEVLEDGINFDSWCSDGGSGGGGSEPSGNPSSDTEMQWQGQGSSRGPVGRAALPGAAPPGAASGQRAVLAAPGASGQHAVVAAPLAGSIGGAGVHAVPAGMSPPRRPMAKGARTPEQLVKTGLVNFAQAVQRHSSYGHPAGMASRGGGFDLADTLFAELDPYNESADGYAYDLGGAGGQGGYGPAAHGGGGGGGQRSVLGQGGEADGTVDLRAGEADRHHMKQRQPAGLLSKLGVGRTSRTSRVQGAGLGRQLVLQLPHPLLECHLPRPLGPSQPCPLLPAPSQASP
jgi:hypothetical protein